MSDTLRLVEIAYADDGSKLVHIEGWGPLASPTMQTVAADGMETAMVTTAVDTPIVDATRADIQARATAGQTPGLKSHLDALGLTAAVTEWARTDG